MKSLIRGSAVALVGAAALLAAYASLSGPPSAGGAKRTAARAFVPALQLPFGETPFANGPFAATGGGSEQGSVREAPPDCDFCLYAADVQTAGSFLEPGSFRGVIDGSETPALSGFGEWPAAPAMTGFEPDMAVAAPASEVSTAAMIALGAVILTARMRRRGWTAWKIAWRGPALAGTLANS